MKTSSEIFTEAASRIVTWDKAQVENKTYACCCHAIFFVSTDNDTEREALGMFDVYFKPRNRPIYWYADPSETDEDQEARRLALLFMAEIATDSKQARYDR